MKYLPTSVIKAAKQNDPEAADIILRHFEGYIASRCLETYEDESGKRRHYVDEDLRYLAENAVFAAIFKFQFRDPPEDYAP